jgi:hypothetical protein
LVGDTLMRSGQLSLGQLSVLGFPFSDGSEAIANKERPTCCPRHPGRDTDTLGCCSVENTFVHVGVDGDRQLR